MPVPENNQLAPAILISNRLRLENEQLRKQVQELNAQVTDLKTRLDNKAAGKPEYFDKFGEIAMRYGELA